MRTRRDVLADAVERLRMARRDTPELDARVLLKEALKLSDTDVITKLDDPASPEGVVAFNCMVARRVRGEPVARIIGHREFWGMRFDLGPETLVPRPDTEILVESALAAFRRAPPKRVLDLGTGTGCILISVLSEFPEAAGVGVDKSERATAVARKNAERLGMNGRARFVVGDWASSLDGRFDLIVSNPPYIARGKIADLDVEVSVHDPHLALDGGSDGLHAYRRVAEESARLLPEGGVVIVELGEGQEKDVASIMREAGLKPEKAAPDLAGIPRALAALR
ncbi:peptide chain release factor N(5)-glutamine methyltransferase [Flaviflagellibacter deserti]|uniref:Release factor glutamine methyltransferase n=1 Tax=Flaviflagellibacter deserti TaxID=2267266 RepID=A0ABV9YXA2_9HYPH